MIYRWPLLVLGLAAVLPATEPVSDKRFDGVVALIRPAEGEEKWTSIPWQAGLWEARSQAAREGKPILLWEMDGHPLGCT